MNKLVVVGIEIEAHGNSCGKCRYRVIEFCSLFEREDGELTLVETKDGYQRDDRCIAAERAAKGQS